MLSLVADYINIVQYLHFRKTLKAWPLQEWSFMHFQVDLYNTDVFADSRRL